MPDTTTLWRPTSPNELDLVEQSRWTEWPARLPEQPIFYPVLSEEYATKIARDWNVPASGLGFVTRFDVATDYLAGFQVQEAGGRANLEYWIPAAELDEFNDHIVGEISVTSAFGELAPIDATAAGFLASDLIEPWWQPDDMSSFERELAKELPPRHLLHGRQAFALARRDDRDDVLFWVPSLRSFGLVHLTYHEERDRRWPRSRLVRAWPTLAMMLNDPVDPLLG